MSSRPDIEEVLDVRSYENIVVIAAQDSTHQYPENWTRPTRLADLDVNTASVVIIDRVELQPSVLCQISESNPRLVAIAMASIEHEKQVRRTITSMFPWSEVWTVFTSFGKLLISKDIKGKAYDRDIVVDIRDPEAEA